MHRSSTVIQAKTGFKKYEGEFRCEKITEDGLFHWRKCYSGLWTHILSRSDSLKLLNDGFVSYKHTFREVFGFKRY